MVSELKQLQMENKSKIFSVYHNYLFQVLISVNMILDRFPASAKSKCEHILIKATLKKINLIFLLPFYFSIKRTILRDIWL